MTFQARTTYDVFCDAPAGCQAALEDVADPGDVRQGEGWVAWDTLDGATMHLCPDHAAVEADDG